MLKIEECEKTFEEFKKKCYEQHGVDFTWSIDASSEPGYDRFLLTYKKGKYVTFGRYHLHPAFGVLNPTTPCEAYLDWFLKVLEDTEKE